MPDIRLHVSASGDGYAYTPERFTVKHWQNKDEASGALKVWAEEGREGTIKWFKDVKNWELTNEESAKLSLLMVCLRQKYKVDKK